MGRGSKIKRIEKNNYSKFKQVLVQNEVKRPQEPETSKEERGNIVTSNKPDKHESPQKPDELEKTLLPETTNPSLTQVKIQETSETSQRPDIPKGQREKTERSERPQIFESPNTIDEHESFKNPDRIAKPLKPEEPQVGNHVIPETCNRPETPKGQRIKTKRNNKSQKFEIPNRLSEYDSPKKADVLEKSQKPEESQIGSQEGLETPKGPEMTEEHEISETTGRPEVVQKSKTLEDKPDGYERPKTPDELSKFQKPVGPQIQTQEGLTTGNEMVKGYEITKKTGRPEIVQKSSLIESPEERLDEHECPKNPDRIAKPLKPEEPQVGNHVIPETCNRPETPKGQRKKTKRNNRSQKFEIPNRLSEYDSPKNADVLEKSQKPGESQIGSQEGLETPKGPEMTKEHEISETTGRPEVVQKSKTLEDKPDGYERPKTPDELSKSQKPVGPQIQTQEGLKTGNEMVKGYEITEKTGRPEIVQKSGLIKSPEERLDEHECPKNPDRIAEPLKPEEPQVGNHVIPETCNRPETPKGQRKKTKRNNRSQKFEIPNRLSEYDSPKKADVLEKSQKPEESQIGSQEGLETPKGPEMTKEHEISETTERPEVVQKSKTLQDKPDGYERPKTPDELSKSQKPVGPQIQTQEGLKTGNEMVKGYEVTEKTGRPEIVQKSGHIESPEERLDEHECPKNLDGLATLQRPEERQVKSQVMPDRTKRPETPKGQRKKTKSQKERSQKFESREGTNKNNSPNKADGLEKSSRFNGPQVHSQQKTQTPNTPTTTNGLGTPKKTKSSEPNEHETKPETLGKPQLPEIPKIHEAIQKTVSLDSPQRPDKPETPVKPERTEKFESSEKLDAKQREKIADIEKIPYEVAIKHPLEHSWGMWLITNDKRNWEDNLVKLTSFNTVEDYWCLYHHMKPPSELERGKDYAVFKNEFRPMWEDSANRNGGRWLINFDKKRNEASDLDTIWMFVILLVIGESFRVPNSICGTVVSIRAKNRVAVWVPNYKNDHAVRDVGMTLRNTLGLRGRLSFQQHDTATSILTF